MERLNLIIIIWWCIFMVIFIESTLDEYVTGLFSVDSELNIHRIELIMLCYL